MRLPLAILLVWATEALPGPRKFANQDDLVIMFITKSHAFMKRPYMAMFGRVVEHIKKESHGMAYQGLYALVSGNASLNDYSPPQVFEILCDHVLKRRSSLVIYISELDSTDYKTASAEFLFKVTNFIGLPTLVVAEDNSGIVAPDPDSSVLLITPSVVHQVQAMLSLLERYNWPAFGVVTGSLAGYELFISSLHRLTDESDTQFDILVVVKILWTENTDHVRKELAKLSKSETRVVLLYASHHESGRILQVADEMGQVGRDFVWILCKTAFGKKIGVSPSSFFPGLLALDFKDSVEAGKSGGDAQMQSREKVIKAATTAWVLGLDRLLREDPNATLVPRTPNCSVDGATRRWRDGLGLIRHMKSLSVNSDNRTQMGFNEDGTTKDAELDILNFDQTAQWKVVGEWSSRGGLDMRDITWPGGIPTPPKGRPAKYHIRVVTLEEKPYIVYSDPDPQLGTCPPQSELCRVAPLNATNRFTNSTTNSVMYQCCSGFCIDLLRLLSERIGFDFELFEVPDKKWGAYDKTKEQWIGLVRTILDGEADMILTSLQITPDRSTVIDFSVPFLETGITIIVAVRDGVISPTAFLEPYDYPSWCLILLFSVHASGASIFIVEWLSPHGLDIGEKPIREHKFSLFRSFWLIWSMLFGAAVNVDNPRGVSGRFLANIWALFAVVFTASYTANLAAFMITKEDYDRLTGIRDIRLHNPYTHKPPFKYATVPYGSTETNLMNNFPDMHDYMKTYNKSTAVEGVRAVKEGEINAFIYDATVLEYQASHDDGCKLRTINKWHARTGYGIGFPKGSKWISRVNQYIVKFQHEGELERLQKFWLAGSCKKNEAKGESSKPLGILNFTSAFILLACGMILGAALMITEHIYFRFFRAKLRRWDSHGCCSLVSLSLGKSLTFQQSVKEAIEMTRHFKCRNPVCETQVWKLKHELDLAQLKIVRLQQQVRKDDENIPIVKKTIPKQSFQSSLAQLRLNKSLDLSLHPGTSAKSTATTAKTTSATTTTTTGAAAAAAAAAKSSRMEVSGRQKMPSSSKVHPNPLSAASFLPDSDPQAPPPPRFPPPDSSASKGGSTAARSLPRPTLGVASKSLLRNLRREAAAAAANSVSLQNPADCCPHSGFEFGCDDADQLIGVGAGGRCKYGRNPSFHRKRERFVTRSAPTTPVKHRQQSKETAPIRHSHRCSIAHSRTTDNDDDDDDDDDFIHSHECPFQLDFKETVRFLSASELPQIHGNLERFSVTKPANSAFRLPKKSLFEIETAL